MPELGIIVVLGLAAYRLARLIAVDSITEEPRAALYRWAWESFEETNARTGRAASDAWPCGFDDKANELEPCAKGTMRAYLYELVSCAFCVGVWCAAGVYLTWAAVTGDLDGWYVAIPAVAGAQALMQCADAALVSVAERDA